MKQLQNTYLYNVDPIRKNLSILVVDETTLYLINYSPTPQTDDYDKSGGISISKAWFDDDKELNTRIVSFGEPLSEDEFNERLEDAKELTYWKFDEDIILEKFGNGKK